MITWFDNRAAFQAAVRQLEPSRRAIEEHVASRARLHGFCTACRTTSDFTLAAGDPNWINLREDFKCPKCGLNGRMRMLVTALDELGEATRGRFHILERCTPLFVFLSERYPNLTGSEFLGPEYVSGTRHRLPGLEGLELEHQDFLNLSFPDSSLELLVHGDVLEHVPDPARAFREAARVLAPGGQMLFTCPFYDRNEHVVRCRIERGGLIHRRPPLYHSNPMAKSEGSLVFTEPAWPLLYDMRKAGFARVEIGLLYNVFFGIVSANNPHPEGNMWPVILRAVK